MAEPYPQARLFRDLLSLFRAAEGADPAPAEALASFERDHPDDLDVLLRATVVHPHPAYRRLAIARLPPARYWSVASFPQAPVDALADILDRLAQDDVGEDYRKIFFDGTSRALAAGRGEGPVRAARRMLDRFFAFDFFIEDDYFGRILRLNETVQREEARLKIDSTFFRRSLEAFKSEKARAGSRKTQLPRGFALIPLTVQRKLAREGHYLSLFVRHPHPKVALETVRFIKTTALAEAVLRIKVANPRVVSELAKKEDLLTSYGARLALLGNPHTPLQAGQRFIPLMRAEDLRKLAASRDISPEIAAHLRARLRRRPS